MGSKQSVPSDPADPRRTREYIMTTFIYEAATLNGVKGWIATRRIDGLYAGKQFGKTKKLAREAFIGL